MALQGFVEAAEIFQRESGTDPGVDLRAITDRMEVRKALQSGNVEDAIDKVNDLNPEVTSLSNCQAETCKEAQICALVWIQKGVLRPARMLVAESMCVTSMQVVAATAAAVDIYHVSHGTCHPSEPCTQRYNMLSRYRRPLPFAPLLATSATAGVSLCILGCWTKKHVCALQQTCCHAFYKQRELLLRI